ncbi:unnamed protein product [Blepharisma stoltei]|uniref:Uncharacterized protein n=1 Tax=Blepharisma stoltei TaxID=1481888 RepID=A0AAU9KAQ5_9CILI|nr:unnamed protein product [Blepharisma stoltei]
MSATAELEKYIEQFKTGYKKYVPSEDTSSMASSIDTDELLSETSSDSSSIDAYSFKAKKTDKIKTLSSLKKKKKKSVKVINKPSYLKPLHTTPLKIINEEEEDPENRRINYNLSEFMPRQLPFDISKYLPQSESQRQAKIKEIIASLDTESETTSICSSIDTEALLNSSDEEEEEIPSKKFSLAKTAGTSTHLKSYSINSYPSVLNSKPEMSSILNPRMYSSSIDIKQSGNLPPKSSYKLGYDTLPLSQSDPAFKNQMSYDGKTMRRSELNIQKANECSVIPRRLDISTNSLSISPISSQNLKSNAAKSALAKSEIKPSAFLNSITESTQSLSYSNSFSKLTLCTCILKGSLYSHFSNCQRVQVKAVIPDNIQFSTTKIKKFGMVESIVLIQREIRNFLSKRKLKKTQAKQPLYKSSPSMPPRSIQTPPLSASVIPTRSLQASQAFSASSIPQPRSAQPSSSSIPSRSAQTPPLLTSSMLSRTSQAAPISTPPISTPPLNSVNEIEKATQSLYQAIEELKSLKQKGTSSPGSSSINSSFSLTEYNLKNLPNFGSKASSVKRYVETPKSPSISSSHKEKENNALDTPISIRDEIPDDKVSSHSSSIPDDISDVNTEELLNSTFSSISSAL